MKAKSEILNKSFEYEVNHKGLILTDNNIIMDEWDIVIEEENVKFYTGIGHRKARPMRMNFNPLTCPPLKDKHYHMKMIEKDSIAIPPNIDDFLYSLVSESDAMELTFSQWCEMLGENPDSIKAMQTYFGCQKSGETLINLGIDLEQARTAFQNYSKEV